MVVGGGIGGIQAALDLAQAGFSVYLVEQRYAIGGTMPILSRTFPSNECSLCNISPRLVECGRKPGVTVMTGTEVLAAEGEPGAFKVRLLEHPRSVLIDRCRACGDCAGVCPVEVPDEFNQGLAKRKAIYQPYPQGFPKAYVVDRTACLECSACEAVCKPEAINRAQKPREIMLDVGAIVLCLGFQPFDPTGLQRYGYGRITNVITSLEFERVLSSGGPSHGRLVMPDGKVPGKIAWVQCVGSRKNSDGQRHCSSVCCMASIKMALAATEQSEVAVEAVIFHQDVRTWGKGYERYYRRARDQGIRFERAAVERVEDAGAGQVRVVFAGEDGKTRYENYDLVVLAVGMQPHDDLPRRLNLKLTEDGFIATGTGSLVTSRPGIYAAGCCTGPKDISGTVTEAAAAASEVAVLLGGARGTNSNNAKHAASERDVRAETPKVGVFVCRCGVNIGGVVDVPQVVSEASKMANVVAAEELTYACSQDSQNYIKEVIRKKGLNRLVIASCSPRTHKFLFQNTLREAGINRYLCEMTNIRDHCAWVHGSEPQKATAKAAGLVRMAVAKARTLEPVEEITGAVVPSALVVGAGAAGLSAALGLAEQGFEVHLVEKSDHLGGYAARTYFDPSVPDLPAFISKLIDRVMTHPLIFAHLQRQVAEVRGHIGNFTSVLDNGDTIKHGVAVLAPGSAEYRGDEYLPGDPDVLTLSEMDSLLGRGKGNSLHNVVFIQCVGSRNETRPYCSRSCCTRSLDLALQVKVQSPACNVYILYRDMMTFGRYEKLYQRARGAGVVFIRFDPEKNKPRVIRNENNLTVSVPDHILRRTLIIDCDKVVLATATVPDDVKALAGLFKVAADSDGYFLEAHHSLRPVDFAAAGIYMCGDAHAPKTLEESILQAKAVAARAGAVLNRGVVEAGGVFARVDPQKCVTCLNCTLICPYNVPVIRERYSEIEPIQCQGCGICVAECPNNAIDLVGYRKDQMAAQVRALLRGEV
ncbi:MAG: CoB--CoM heterodisulfide reductase iron-sulfur subunit A family protein [Peptococcaceae bacterium]|nr:CoB--CoM heterodisulfide reductase iron-sulfur subunit A family protein [Peptococcaceae bacterium]